MTKTKFKKETVLQTFGAYPLIPLFYEEDIRICKQWIKACYDGGVRAVEFTNRGERALAVFTELVAWTGEECPGLVLGIGTIKDRETAEKFIAAGAGFVVAPVLDTEVGEYCIQKEIAWIPGCGTLTEMYNAHKYGADIVKAFPARALGGAGYIKAVLAPCPELKIMPSGGIDADPGTYQKYRTAGAFCVGVGSSLFSGDGTVVLKPEVIRKRCQEILKVKI
ncbi:bifunctional 4-hydroxy-2-oxoglutarate aldolase/2-dehydro-3-deoxy-phosphogluconate aldolase [Sinomicrobium sp. M5D2P9]